MDKEFEEAISQSNYRAIFENQKEKLKEILQGQLLYSCNGGQFQLNVLLFSEVILYLNDGKTQHTILDMNLNPIRIANLEEFLKDIRSRYTEAVNKYTVELSKLKRSRQIPTLIQLDVENDTEE